MSIYVNGNISKVYVGTSSISKAYVGNQLVFSGTAEVNRPFYFQVTDVTGQAKVGFERYSRSFVNSSASNPPTINYSKFTNYTAPTLQYSYNGVNWNSYTLGSTITLGGSNSNIVYFQGDNTASWYDSYTVTTTETKDGEQVSYEHEFRVWTKAIVDITTTEYLSDSTKVKSGGNIMSLRYKSFSGKVTLPCINAFRALFYKSKIISPPVLPATTLTNACYASMFQSSNLEIAPTLPATTMKIDCYASMFANTNITKAPTLSATTLAKNCYGDIVDPSEQTSKTHYGMFGSCRKLTAAPALPAKTLAESCYSYMFSSCDVLTSAPALPATTLANYCYYSMFSRCKKITATPTLAVTSLAEYCYSHMFDSCSALTTVSTLPATTLKVGCYNYMFGSCTSLKNPPSLPATTLADECYDHMFYSCTALAQIPRLKATTLPEGNISGGCYYMMFYDSNVRANATSSGVCTKSYRIPTSGTGSGGNKAMGSMFPNIDNSDTFVPSINTTFYINLNSFA